MEKISLDEARALIWHEEVDNELKQVSELNKQVAICVKELQDDDDPLVHVLKGIGEKIESYGNALGKNFAIAMESLKAGIQKYKEVHENLTQEAETLKSNIGG